MRSAVCVLLGLCVLARAPVFGAARDEPSRLSRKARAMVAESVARRQNDELERARRDASFLDARIRSKIGTLLNEPATLEIELRPRTSPGAFRHVSVRFERSVFDDLTLANGTVDFDSVQVDLASLFVRDKLLFEGTTAIRVRVEVLESDLNAYLDRKRDAIKVRRPRVRLSPGRLSLSGNFRYGVASVDFEAAGHFQVRESTKIDFLPTTIRLNGLAMPGFAVKRVIRRINPILDLGEFPFPFRMREIRIDERRMTFESLP